MARRRCQPPSAPPRSRATIIKKWVGVFAGAMIGTFMGVVQGRRVKCPPWRAGSLFGRGIDTEWVAFWGLAGMLAGGAFAGRRVGRIGWSIITGTFAGPFAGTLVWGERHRGAMAGAVVGLLRGTALDLSLRQPARETIRRRWWLAVLAMVCLGSLIVAAHVDRERHAAGEVARLGGRVQWECGCVRYVYDLAGIDDVSLRRLANELANLAALKSLSLSNSRVTDAGLASLERVSSLQWLYLGDTRVTDAGLPCLKQMVHLEYLDLSGTSVTDQGVTDLRSALPRLEKVRR